MKDLATHFVLLAAVGLAIVALNAVFVEPDDARALKSMPKRLLWFFAGCGLLAGLLLLLEHLFASVD